MSSDTMTRKVVVSARGQQWDTTRCLRLTWEPPIGSFINDIALFQGKLYILTTEVKHYQPELHILDDGQEEKAISSTPRVDHGYGGSCYDPYSTHNYVQRHYLVVSGDQLLMVERTINNRIKRPPMFPRNSGIEKRTRHFKVYEAADLSSGCGRWMEVDTLRGRALFVSEGCSESLPAVGQCGDIGVREDCIYFINENEKYTATHKKIRENPMLDSGVYSMRDKTVMPLLLETMVTPSAGDGPWFSTWLFPET
uniref:Uncharacterized protein n=1 Tax=Avena sativa TaxID=4498 RepID=A0ACD5XY46_AVESA